MEFKEIELSDKDIIEEYISKFQPEASELTFTNLFAWVDSKKNEFCIFEDHMIIRNKDYLYTPLGPDPSGMILKLMEMDKTIQFDRIEASVAEKVEGVHVCRKRDHSDYVYLLENLRELPGSKFRAKRQFIRRINRLNPDVETIERVKDNIPECKKLADKWLEGREMTQDILDEQMALNRVLDNYSELNVAGICIKIDGKIEAFAIGEPLNALTYVDHFEKANPELKGLYQHLLNEFSKFIPDSYTYLNREQDLGIPGLKKAKKSYYPIHMVNKFRISHPDAQSD